MTSPSPGVAGSPKRFRIAFSFAGEKRDYVAEMARLLAARFGEDAILYDKYHEAEFANPNLAFGLPKLYRDESDLIVPVFCPDYERKDWCRLEWRAIYSIIMARDPREIMPARFDHAQVDSLNGLSGFIELDEKPPGEAVVLILERLAINEGKPKDHYKIRPPVLQALSTPIPHNLPGLQPFFGRENELRIIADALDPDSRIWGALIDGPGGMGKTSLAVRAAYDAPPEDFGRIIFISLKTRELDDDGERDLSGFILTGLQELYNELARELGQPEIAKLPEEQRPRMLLDALRGTKTLLILDNLESLTKGDRGTILTFVKKLPAGCKAILTSRGRIGSGAEELILEKLDQDAALQTLAELATHNPALAKTSEAERIALYTQTGGKPLLLRWTAGQIGRGHCLTFTDAIEFLRSCPKDNDPLEFIFGDLAEDFSEDETKILAALSYFTLRAKVKHIAALVDLDEDTCLRSLKSLVNRSLVVPTDELDAFVLVPMVADFLRKHRASVVNETGGRLMKRAFALIAENGLEYYERFPVLDVAWDSVAPALRLFLAGPNVLLQAVCEALRDFLNFTGRWDEWLSLVLQAETKSGAAGDELNAGWRAYEAGMIYYFRRQAEEVLAGSERAEAHWTNARADAQTRACAIRLQGLGHNLKEDYPAAIIAYREVLEICRHISAESVGVAVALNSLAGAERRSGDYDAAERDYLEALRVARAVDYFEGVPTYMSNLAILALDREDWATAEALSKDALPLAEKLGRQELVAAICCRLSAALERQGGGTKGVPYALRAVEIYSRLGSPDLKMALAILRECEATSE